MFCWSSFGAAAATFRCSAPAGWPFCCCTGCFLRFALPLFAQCLVGGLVITAIEFGRGAIVNVRLKLNVWDYSKMPLNCHGQVCLPFSRSGAAYAPHLFLKRLSCNALTA